jgi:hypothetical protein
MGHRSGSASSRAASRRSAIKKGTRKAQGPSSSSGSSSSGSSRSRISDNETVAETFARGQAVLKSDPAGIRGGSRSGRDTSDTVTSDNLQTRGINLPDRTQGEDLSSLTNGINSSLGGANGGVYDPAKGFVPPTTTEAQPDTSTSLFNDYLQANQEANAARPSSESLTREMQRELRPREDLVNSYQNQITQITNTRDQKQIGLVGQGRGVPEAIIGGQQAQIGREAAIQALPIQSQLAAAQGDLESARSYLGQLYTAKAQDAQNEYNYRTALNSSIYQFLDSQEKTRMAANEKELDRNYAESQNNLNFQRQLGMQALEFGQTDLISGISGVDTSSPTFEQDMAVFTSQMKDPAVDALKARTAAQWIANNETVKANQQFETLSGEIAEVPSFEDYASSVGGKAYAMGALTPAQLIEIRNNYEDEKSVMEQAIRVSSLSNIAKAIVQDPKQFSEVTATVRGEVLEELARAGIDTTEISLGKKKELPAGIVDNISQGELARRNVLEIYDLLQNLPGNGPISGRLLALDPYSEEMVRLKAQITRTVPGLARGIYKEVGVLTDTDVARYTDTIANGKMTDEQIESLHNDTMSLIDESLGITIDNFEKAGYNTGNFMSDDVDTVDETGLSEDEAYELYLEESKK